ncbi:phosphoribosylformylglycinamidine synthase [Spiroplasma litorale]|uniref:Phosphoribosylformylglycinamidine synthase n=1 Tax=Spiroplasma litorale TaxID=216942 RepID=A0A0K1W2M1_9MOLU|nr:phosphoribosylformylglycinamidine synthase [Spiroplasma litorale]AKX34579.1 phosphoribosylformylglycinamidine synthase [Spiroplasma litorale]
MINRVYINKKDEFDIESKKLSEELAKNFNIKNLNIKVFNVYDVHEEDKTKVAEISNYILAEPNIDDISFDLELNSKKYFAVKMFDSQFNPREESASECCNLLYLNKTKIKTFKLYIFNSEISESQLKEIKNYIINPIECYEFDMNKNEFEEKFTTQELIEYNFNNINKNELEKIYYELNLAMSFEDFSFTVNYFNNELKRNATDSEIYLIDTYWSDHCRHKTFETVLENISFDKNINPFYKDKIEEALNYYKSITSKKDITLMNIATSYIKYMLKTNNAIDIEVSDEINASSIYVDLDDNKKCIVQFKNETHNHPTEIEPFGGAATCLGGAIRDPLSGRAYVYQGIRVTGAGNILEDIQNSMSNKLPQSKISKLAADGFSSYGNQIGIPTTLVKEFYHKNYVAKRLEIGAVVGVTKINNLIREEPKPGDLIVLVGGATGKDGIGGATGSSKNQNQNSIKNSYSEVQKGNPVEERKLQRLFSNPKVSKIIKKANDLGAGGIGVGAGELADGVKLNLNNVHLKYLGLSGKEILISESQERMVVVIDKSNLNTFIEEANKENLVAVKLGEVTSENSFVVEYKNKTIVNLPRDFINTGGIKNKNDVLITNNLFKDFQREDMTFTNNLENDFLVNISCLNVMSQKPMIEQFDFSIGGTTVLAPYGGTKQLSEVQVSCQKIPLSDNKNICTIMSYGYNPFIFENNILLGSMYAIIESITKVIASGGNFKKLKLTLQEYFEKLNKDKEKWAKPFVALLGALIVQKEFNIPAIGGKDSMSGTYENISVPPTLVSFALSIGQSDKIISTDFKEKNNHIYLFKHNAINNYPNFNQLKNIYKSMEKNILENKILSSFAIQSGGIAEALAKMSFGNDLGFDINTNLNIFDYMYGSIIVETNEKINDENLIYLGVVSNNYSINGFNIDKVKALNCYLNPIKKVYLSNNQNYPLPLNDLSYKENKKVYYPNKISKINIMSIIFPGTNCEYDIKRSFKNESVSYEDFVFNNMNVEQLNLSLKNLANKIKDQHIIVIPGGFSLGDEPDGSGKYISNVLKSKIVKEALIEHLKQKKLILGICNGFQALLKSGLLIYGEPCGLKENDPSLIKNNVNRHVSKYVSCRTVNNSSPWTQDLKINEINVIPISHGEGRFVINESMYKELKKNNQIVFEYLNEDNNPNGSYYNIEGIVSKCGLILGKMGHSERFGQDICKNIYGNKEQNIFKSAIRYFLNLEE